MKKILLSLLALASISTMSAAGKVTLQGVEYTVDTLRHIKVGPGTMQTSMRFSSASKSFNAFLLSMEMKGHDNVEYRMEIGNDTTLTTERISSVAQRKTVGDTHYFAGVNADFYITTSYVPQYAGQPHMDCIMNGEFASTGYLAAADYGHFFMDRNKNMWCDNPTQSFTITYPDGTTVALPRINQDIFDGETVLFNSKYGRQTRVSGTTNVQVKLAEGEQWCVNKPIKLVVASAPTSTGCTAINKGEAVLSALGAGAAHIAALKEGDVLTANFSVALQDYKISPDIKETSGGDVVILKRGEVIYEAHRFINARDGNNPRTMLGYNEDRSMMYWGLVDGRSGESAGCTYPEGAEVMKFFGCYDALNVDGGGSSGMYVKTLGVVNDPCDSGGERSVSNGIFAVLNAPADNVIAEIRFVDWKMIFPKYGIYVPVMYGYNQYGLLVDTDVKGFELSCAPELGEIISDGTAFYGTGGGSGELVAEYNGLKASLPITIDATNAPELKYTDVLLDNYRKWPVDIQSLVLGNYMAVDPQALSWASSDESVAEIDAMGVVTGKSNGSATLTGSVGDFSGSVNLTIECPAGPTMAIESPLNTEAWTAAMSGVGIKDYGVSALGESGMSIDYTLASGRSRSITINRSGLKVWSLPDAIRFTINPGNQKISTATMYFRANNGVVKNYTLPAIPVNTDTAIEIPVSDFADVNDIGIYPIYVSGFNFVLSGGTTGNAYSIKLPNFEAVYNNAVAGVEDIVVDEIVNAPAVYFNLQGMKIANPESGLYIVKRGNKVAKEYIRK